MPNTGRPPHDHDLVLVVNFGAQYAQLIARRVREARVYAEIVPRTMPIVDMLAKRPKAIILSGGPASVHEAGAPDIDPAIFTAGVPVLGICYGAQLLAQALGGRVERSGVGEYGRTALEVTAPSVLFKELPTAQDVWMSHKDCIVDVPSGFVGVATTASTPVAALEDTDRALFGIQFHPEVTHTPRGMDLLKRFLFDVCDCQPTWTHLSIIEDTVAEIRERVGDANVICGLSGGVDSAVAAALVHKAIGDQLHCVFVDTGLLRLDEAEEVETTFRDQFHVDLHVVKAHDEFLDDLRGVTDPEDKRKRIGLRFIESFEIEAAKFDDVRFLVQGTLYPDVVESGGADHAKIKTHHNVGGLPDVMQFALVEPLRTLFKDEVRAIGEKLGLPERIVWRQPFPGPGLAVRIIGEVTDERLAILREADRIIDQEIRRANLYRQLWQCFAVLLAVNTVGVTGDGRVDGYPIVLRAVESEDAMTADWARLDYDLVDRISRRIVNEVDGAVRVVLDVTSKPPGTIEWE